MKKKLIRGDILVQKSTLHGYGVFATKKIKKNQKIEECYFILSPKGGDKKLEDFYFDANGKYAIILGYGSIYNHSDEPNADYTINLKNRIATFKANKMIKKGEEIFVSYGEKWFSSRGKKAKKIT